MLQMTKLFTLLLLLIFFYELNGQCDPCEEYTDCVFSYNYNYDVNSNNTNVTVFTWKINENDVANCYTENNMECLSFENNEKRIDFTIQKEKKSLIVQAILSNVSRYNSSIITESRLLLYGNFRNKDIGQQLLYTCDLNIYTKLKGLECVTQNTTKGLLILCLSTKVYPPCTCVFNVTINKKQLYLKPKYNNILESENPPYYRTKCSVEVVEEQLVKGKLEYQVAMIQILSKDCYKSTPCYALQVFSPSLNIGSIAIFCTAEKPYNCSNSCYTNDEFCHDGKIYPCQNASHVVTNIQEWCRSRSREDESKNQSLSCNTACKSYIITPLEENGTITNKQMVIIIFVSSISLALLVCGVIAYLKIKFVRKPTSARNANNSLYKTAAIEDLRDICGDDQEPLTTTQDTCSVNLPDETDPSVSTIDLLNHQKDIKRDSQDDCSDETFSTSSVTSQELTDFSDMSQHCSDEQKSSAEKYVTINIKIPADNVPSKSPMQETRSDENCDNSLAENAQQEDNELVKIKVIQDLFHNLRLQHEDYFKTTECLAVSWKASISLKSKSSKIKIITFFIQRPKGSVLFHEAQVPVSLSISDIKQDLKPRYNIPAEEQLLYLKGILMEDDKCLKDYDISSHDRILVKDKRQP